MTTRRARLLAPSGAVLATTEVRPERDHYGGAIDLRQTPDDFRRLFEEFEEIVNGQMFVFLDEIQGKIAAAGVTAVFEDGTEGRVEDLQVFPSTGDVSFRLAGVLVRAAEVT